MDQGMPAPIIDDELWTLIEPLLPPPKPRRTRYPGRLPVSDRAALNGILLILKTGDGTICRPGWDSALERLAGVGCTTGSRPGCGTSYTGCCSTSCANLANSISHMRLSIHRPCEPSGRAKNRAKPH